MLLIVGTNVIASRRPERQPTGTPITCANYQFSSYMWLKIQLSFAIDVYDWCPRIYVVLIMLWVILISSLKMIPRKMSWIN